MKIEKIDVSAAVYPCDACKEDIMNLDKAFPEFWFITRSERRESYEVDFFGPLNGAVYICMGCAKTEQEAIVLAELLLSLGQL